MKKRSLMLAFIGLLQACGGTQTGGDPEAQWKAELMRADELFSETIGQEGLSQWGSFFTDDGAVIQAGIGEIRGVEAIQASMDEAAAAVTSFSWVPERAEVSAGGDLGYTVGHYRTTAVGPEGVEIASTGMYMSIWRRQEDGGWKVEMDLGNPTGTPESFNPAASESEEGGS